MRRVVILLLIGLAGGCTPTTALRRTPRSERVATSKPPVARFGPVSGVVDGERNPVVPVEARAPAAQAVLTLDDLIGFAVSNHPEVRAAHARAEVARGRMIQAGLYPNPVFGANLDQIERRRIGEPGLQINQTFVTADKLRIARSAAAHGVEAADWQAVTRWHDTVYRVRLAYYELLTSLRERDVMADIVRVSNDAYEAAKAFEKRGVGNRPDVLRASVELEQNKLKREVTACRVEAAWQSLRTALGQPTLALDKDALARNALDAQPPAYEWDALLMCLQERSAVLQEARAVIAQQERLVARARADVMPNIDVQANPYYDADGKDYRLQLSVIGPLPIYDRNQGNIHAARAELSRVIAEEKNLELQLAERLTLAYQRYQAARQQVHAYDKTIVPEARESLRLIKTGYDAGDKKFDYTAVLQAQQILFQTQLAQTQALGEQWRAAVEIAALLQQDHLAPECSAR